MKHLGFLNTYLAELGSLRNQMVAPDDAFITRELADAVLRYLRSFPLVVRTTARQPDLISGSHDSVVPSSICTDGEWIWSRAVEYYIDVYQVSPGSEFLTYLASINFQRRQPTGDEMQAASALFPIPNLPVHQESLD